MLKHLPKLTDHSLIVIEGNGSGMSTIVGNESRIPGSGIQMKWPILNLMHIIEEAATDCSRKKKY